MLTGLIWGFIGVFLVLCVIYFINYIKQVQHEKRTSLDCKCGGTYLIKEKKNIGEKVQYKYWCPDCGHIKKFKI